MIDAAIQRRDILKAEYAKLGQDITPLIIIQLPNDETVETSAQTTESHPTTLGRNGIQSHLIATWLSNKKENMEGIEHNQQNRNSSLANRP